MTKGFEEFDVEKYYKDRPELRPPGANDFPMRTDSHVATDANLPATNKYHAQRTNGYPSKKHAQYASDLALRKVAGEVWYWLEEVPFKLPGLTKTGRPIVHRVDFMVFYPLMVLKETNIPFYVGKAWELIEVKGRDLELGRLKRAQVEALYNVKITVV